MATAEDLYSDLEDVPFPESEIKELLGTRVAHTVGNFQTALQLPFATVFLAMVSMMTFSLHRTVAQYTPMLGVPPLPWMVLLGRTGDSKSLMVWLIKQVILEIQTRTNRRRAKEAKKPALADDILEQPELREDSAPPAAPSQNSDAMDVESDAADAAEVPAAAAEAPADAAEASAAPPLEEEELIKLFQQLVDEANDAEDTQGSVKWQRASYTTDTGTVFGWGAKMRNNGGRVFVALHEGKILLLKVINDTPGCDGQPLNKLYDRDEFSNTVLTKGSQFQELQPWVVLFLAMHCEDLRDIFDKDPLGIFNRFDWFARKGHIANLEDYGPLEQDEAIFLLADLLEIAEAQFPDLSADPRRALENRHCYSRRINLWRIKQDSKYFKASFNDHAAKQREAKEVGDEKTASFESKVKTKECRYACPVDALCKAIEQKLILDRYHDRMLAAAATKKEEFTWLTRTAVEAREHLLNNPRLAEELGVPEQWPISVTEKNAQIGHHITTFLGRSSALVSAFLNRNGQHKGPAATARDSGAGMAIEIIQVPELAAAVKRVYPVDRVLKLCQAVLGHPQQAFRLGTLKKTKNNVSAGLALNVATSLLTASGLVQVTAFKRAESPGKPATWFVKRPKAGGPGDTDLAVADASPGVQAFFSADMDEGLGSLAELQVHFPAMTPEEIETRVQELKLLVDQAKTEEAAVVQEVDQAVSPQKREQAFAGLAAPQSAKRSRVEVDAGKAAAIRAHFLWVLGQCTKAKVDLSYVQKRAPGWSTEAGHWSTVTSTLGALGLVRDVTRGSGLGSILVMRPSGEEDRQHVVSELVSWLDLNESHKKVLAQKLTDAEANPDFARDTFDVVMRALREQREVAIR